MGGDLGPLQATGQCVWGTFLSVAIKGGGCSWHLLGGGRGAAEHPAAHRVGPQ